MLRSRRESRTAGCDLRIPGAETRRGPEGGRARGERVGNEASRKFCSSAVEETANLPPRKFSEASLQYGVAAGVRLLAADCELARGDDVWGKSYG
jgi:hypothetical protein